MLRKYAGMKPARYHMPGHKGKANIYDVTEISTTDNLNSPEAEILKAQRALSRCYGSVQSFFMVNGSTGAIQAMVKYASIESNYPILVSRNSHKSIFAACMMFGVDIITAEDEYDDTLQTFVFDETLYIDLINKNNLSAVILTSVDYFGRVIDLAKIAILCKEKGILLLCDEAHGSHFNMNDLLPQSAMRYADICVHSPHKTLSALTQCAYIHVSSTSIDLERLKSIIYSLQTTSPSFLLLESMDSARYEAEIGAEKWAARAEQADNIRTRLNEIEGIMALDAEWARAAGCSDKDETRLVIDVSKIGSGIEIGKMLESKYGIFMEMYSFKHIVGILTPQDDISWDEKLIRAFTEISNGKSLKQIQTPIYPKAGERRISMHKAFESRWEKVMLKEVAGRVSASLAGSYPPGVPLILPGEIITEQQQEYMLTIKNLGGSLFGIEEGYINCVKGEL